MKLLIICSFSFFQAFISTFLSIVLALPLAHFFYRYNFFGKNVLASSLCILAFVPTRVIVFSVQFLTGASGFLAIILAHLLFNIPFSFYFLMSLYQKLDYTTVMAAKDLGASRLQVYTYIVIPFLLTGLFSFSLLLFLLHFSSFTIPLLLGGSWYHKTPSIMIANCYGNANLLQAFFYWFSRLLIVLFIMIFQYKKVIFNKYASLPINKESSQFVLTKKVVLQVLYLVTFIIFALSAIICFFYNACSLQVGFFLLDTLKGLKGPILGCSMIAAILKSIAVACFSSLLAISVAFYLCVANFLWGKKFRFFISFLTIAPFIIGSVGIGILFYYVSLFKIMSPFAVAIFAHVVLNYPFCYKIINGQMLLYHLDMHKTAQTYGLTSLDSFFWVALPFIKSSFYKAFCVAFCLSLTEVGAGSVLQDKMGVTLPMAIKLYRKTGMQAQELGATVIMLVIFLLICFIFGNKKYCKN